LKTLKNAFKMKIGFHKTEITFSILRRKNLQEIPDNE